MKKLCLIIPCYNEEKRLQLDLYGEFLQKNPEINFCFVNDGSRDGTLKLLSEFAAKHNNIPHVLPLEDNKGKAEAVRQGVVHVLQKGYEFVGFWDADLATPLEEIPIFLTTFEKNPAISCVMGIRLARLGAQVKRNPLRHYLGRFFATFASIVLDLQVYDTQCGAKIFKRDLASIIFPEPFISRWLFDVELLYRIKLINPELIFELPLMKWHDAKGSSLKTIDFIKAPLELLNIYRTYHPRGKNHA